MKNQNVLFQITVLRNFNGFFIDVIFFTSFMFVTFFVISTYLKERSRNIVTTWTGGDQLRQYI